MLSLPSLRRRGRRHRPDLTGGANRYTLRDLLENIIEPSKVISDQYESSILELKDGSTSSGRIIGEEDGILQVATNPSAPKTPRNRKPTSGAAKSADLSHAAWSINRMNQDEVLDLIAYILAAGDPKHRCSNGEKSS